MEAPHVVPLGVEHLHAVVAPVGHVDVAVRIHRNAGRPVELTLAAACLADGLFELAVAGEHLVAVVAPVGHIDVAELVHVHTPRQVELAGFRPV